MNTILYGGGAEFDVSSDEFILLSLRSCLFVK